MLKALLLLTIASVTLAVSDQPQRASTSQSTSAASQSTAKIVLDAKRWYQVNNTTSGLDALFDGDIVETVNTGWGKVLTNFDAYYPLLPGERISIDSLRMYDGAGTNTDTPMTLSVITDKW